ncbi:DUF1775 domain-containing protein [Ammoniphilus resinae]|uniref:DUF1775 domain-containing protein n=1 Tax=Ammoniphilus resinae TaxID=861532 RepID=UPI00315977AC
MPKQTTQGTYEVFTVRVPSEEDVPTVKVEVKVPDGVNVSRLEPKSEWNYELTKDDTGKITAITWTTTGKGLGATEFGEFKMQGKVADDATELVWKAYQTYEDGLLVEWVGTEGSDKPASVTLVAAGTGDAHGHGGGAGDTAQGEPAGEQADQGEQGTEAAASSSAPYGMSIAALALSAVALVMAMRKRGGR